MKWGQDDLFPTNPDLADIVGRTDLDFENLFLVIFWTQFSGFPGPQISKFPDVQVPRFPDAGAARRTLRSQPDPYPTAPKDQIRRKEPLLLLVLSLTRACSQTVYKRRYFQLADARAMQCQCKITTNPMQVQCDSHANAM